MVIPFAEESHEEYQGLRPFVVEERVIDTLG